MYCRFCKESGAGGAVGEFQKPKPNYATVAIHESQDPDEFDFHCVVSPIITASTYEQPEPGVFGKFFYSRISNPTRKTLENCLAALDGAKHGYAFASGLGASATIAELLSRGDHILCCDDVYGGTSRLFRHIISTMGIDTTFADFTDLSNVQKGLQNNTKMIWVESPTNPMMKIIDIAGVAKIAKAKGNILVVVDNTFLTSYLQRPLDFGADIVVYSLTKYVNGHSDVIMGAACLNDDNVAKQLGFLQWAVGIIPSPIDCYLVLRSLKTLSLRMKQHKKTSLKIAKWLRENPHVAKVLHPELPDHPGHEIAKKQSCGHSGCFSFIHKGGLNESRKLLTSVKMFTLAESLGGYESLIELPCLMTHASIPAEDRERLGITDALIRISVGLEDYDSLAKDLEQAFNKAFSPGGDKCEHCNKCESCR